MESMEAICLSAVKTAATGCATKKLTYIEHLHYGGMTESLEFAYYKIFELKYENIIQLAKRLFDF